MLHKRVYFDLKSFLYSASKTTGSEPWINSNSTAVPNAENTVADPCKISVVSKSVLRIAFAPIFLATSTSRSKDSFRAHSHSSEYDVTSPPNNPSIPATIFPPTPLVRTVSPLMGPIIFLILYPGILGIVTTMISSVNSTH